MIFRAAYRVGFEEYAIRSLLAATSSYGEPTVCLVRTVCTFSYFSYEREWCQQRQIAGVIELTRGFNLSYLTLKAVAFKRSYVWLTVTEEVILVFTLSYLTYEEKRNYENYLKEVAELMLSFNLIYLLLKSDKNCPNSHVITSCGEPCGRSQHFHAGQRDALLPP